MYINSHLEDFIQKVYQDINVLSPTQLNLYAIADALDIGLFPINDRSQALRFEGRDYVFLNNDLTSPERFEVFGHELGHLLIHAGNQASMSQDFKAYQEWQADSFALHFCIPTFMLQELKLSNSYNKTIYKITKLFGVTPEFAEKRFKMYQMKLTDSQRHTYSK